MSSATTFLSRSLFGPAWAVLAFSPLIAINLPQLLSTALLPISKPLFYRFNMQLAIGIWSWWSVIIERFHRTTIEVFGDELPPGESAVVFSNHQSMTDVVVLLCMARRGRRMADMRWMVKDDMRFVPFLGWAMLFLDFLFLKRDWAKDRERIAETFARLRERATPVWLVLFPEGTRRTPSKHAASMKHAAKSGLQLTERVMIPRTKGFVASVQGLAGKIDAVYRLTIVYPGAEAPSLYQMFMGRVRRMRIEVKRHAIDTVPEGEEAMADWLRREFLRMDDTLATGSQAYLAF